jgi:hypothetical protein
MNVQEAFSSPVFYQPPYVWIPSPRGLGARELTTAEKYAIKYGVPLPGSLRGLGQDLTSPQTLNAITSTAASTTVSILMALGTVTGGVGVAIGALIAVGSLVANMFHGCGQTCIIATQDVNKFEAQVFRPNLDAYRNSPVRTKSLQAAALNNFDTAAKALYQALSDPSLGAAGQRGISERLVRGGTAPWCPNPGHTGCDWYALYRDPIANDPNVVDDSAITQTSGGGGSSSGGGGGGGSQSSSSLVPVLVIGGLILLAVL